MKMLRYLRLIPLAIMIVLAIIFLKYRDDLTVLNIAQHSPTQIWLAILFLFGLYALKSLSVVFPIIVIIAVGGYIFGIFWGIIVNIFGSAVTLSIPYWIGRFTTLGTSQNWLKKYPKLDNFIKTGIENSFLLSLFSRTLFFLPCDILSLYMGIIKINYLKYITGAIIGFMPMIICTTIMGENVSDISSPAFIISGSINLVISIVTISIYLVVLRRKRKKVNKKTMQT